MTWIIFCAYDEGFLSHKQPQPAHKYPIPKIKLSDADGARGLRELTKVGAEEEEKQSCAS
ncbi:hypothetical protein ACTXT7_001742 [Hymenolepis weldensis]